MSFSAADHAFMARALQLARRGLNTTTPNPRVGCVIVRDGHVIGEGWHEKAGGPHAEAACAGAIVWRRRARAAPPPMSRWSPAAISAARRPVPMPDRRRRRAGGRRDARPESAGGRAGLARLAAAGIEVANAACWKPRRTELNIGFVSRMTRGRPWLRLKVAASLDGKTALNNGLSQWITGPDARRDAHAWRARSCAVLTGIGTVRDDNPRLTVRDVPTTRQPCAW
jgi:diaminohydroxyphosphoribosylaminopyrimidine deaminase/5-amino-6-(5-phosphoribosylamino)uracil reductase